MKAMSKSNRALMPAFMIGISVISCAVLSACGSSRKYAGHGFDYMHGYSSTDFSDYMVYSTNSKLAVPASEASLRIEHEADMPVLDGAEACYPMYAAFAKAVYQDIDVIEKEWLSSSEDQAFNGKIVTFSNSVLGFDRLLYKDDSEKYGGGADMFFGAQPSEKQVWQAEESGIDIEVTPIAKEAFVFFAEADNPVDNLTTEQFKAIYHGDLTNWKDAGGKNQKIVPFQRPANSGSQTMMKYFMGDTELMAPKTYQIVDAMSGVISRVAQYANEKGALGYSFRYFLEELNQEQHVKILSVDGVYPSLENIENGTYPLVTNVCVITKKDDPNPYVKKMVEYILSDEGQEIIRKTGYAGLD